MLSNLVIALLAYVSTATKEQTIQAMNMVTCYKSLKVKQSFSNKSTPYDNACVEGFFSNFKREEINSHNFEFYDELAECVDSYMKYYNDYRPHESLQNKTPNQVENDYWLGV